MSQPGSGWWVASVGLFGDLAGVGRRDGGQICAGNVRFLRPEELRILTGLRLHMTPGAILHPAAILVQSVNGTAEGPGLVLYPRQSCPSIALGLLLDWGSGRGKRIARRLGGLCYEFAMVGWCRVTCGRTKAKSVWKSDDCTKSDGLPFLITLRDVQSVQF